MKINKEHVVKVAKGLGKLIVYGAVCALYLGHNNSKTEIYYHGPVGYSEVVQAIVESNMLDSYKREALELLSKDRDEVYYESMISVINSNMLDSYKIDAIKTLS